MQQDLIRLSKSVKKVVELIRNAPKGKRISIVLLINISKESSDKATVNVIEDEIDTENKSTKLTEIKNSVGDNEIAIIQNIEVVEKEVEKEIKEAPKEIDKVHILENILVQAPYENGENSARSKDEIISDDRPSSRQSVDSSSTVIIVSDDSSVEREYILRNKEYEEEDDDVVEIVPLTSDNTTCDNTTSDNTICDNTTSDNTISDNKLKYDEDVKIRKGKRKSVRDEKGESSRKKIAKQTGNEEIPSIKLKSDEMKRLDAPKKINHEDEISAIRKKKTQKTTKRRRTFCHRLKQCTASGFKVEAFSEIRDRETETYGINEMKLSKPFGDVKMTKTIRKQIANETGNEEIPNTTRQSDEMEIWCAPKKIKHEDEVSAIRKKKTQKITKRRTFCHRLKQKTASGFKVEDFSEITYRKQETYRKKRSKSKMSPPKSYYQLEI